MKARIVLEASRLAVLLSVFLASRAGAQVLEDPETFAVERTWNVEREIGIAPHLVDLSFSRSGDSLYVVGCLFCEPSNTLYAVPVIRDPETKKILELGDATVVFTGTIYHLSSAPVFGPQGTLFYSYRRAEKLAQRRGGLAGPETIFDLQSLAGPPEAGGVTFSPHLVDSETGFGMLQLSSWTLLTHDIYNVHLRPLPAGLFAPQRSELFARLPGPASGNGLAGSIRYIPSGPKSGDLLYANWNSGEIKIMVIDKATGLAVDARTGNPTLGTRRPTVLRFASGMGNGPMGLAFDPVGGDLFISTNRGNPRNAIIQIGGFPPPDEAPVDLFPAASFTIRPVGGSRHWRCSSMRAPRRLRQEPA